MRDTTRLWILGAADPEMAAIEELLRECGEQIMYALDEHGERVTAAGAYSAGCTWYGPAQPDPTEPGDVAGEDYVLYCVECAPTTRAHITIDHHRPGDPGYGRPPAEFLSASSLGQVIAELGRLGRLPEWRGWVDRTAAAGHIHTGDPCDGGGSRWMVANGDAAREIPTDLVLAAAADHCLAAAYAGQCPGVDPISLGEWRIDCRAAQRERSDECVPPRDYRAEIVADLERANELLTAATMLALVCQLGPDGDWVRGTARLGAPVTGRRCSHHGGVRAAPGLWWANRVLIADLRGQHVPELPEAACSLGVAYLATVTDSDGRTKVVLGGCGDGTVPGTAPVEAFLGGWAQEQGLVDLYGDAVRGFAGGYQ